MTLSSEMAMASNSKWSTVVKWLILGYLCMSRSFAYLGIPQWNLFVGEVALAYFLLSGPKTASGRWPWVALKDPDFRTLKRLFVLLFVFGVFQVVRGIHEGQPPLTAARDLAFNYYPLYLFLGMWVGMHSPRFLRDVLYLLAWLNGLYGLAFILFLNRVDWIIPGVSKEVWEVRIFGQPLASAIALLALLAFEKDLKSVWHVFLLNLFVLLGMQIRGEWLAFGVGLLLWAWMGKHLKKLASAGAYVVLLLGLMYAIDLNLPGPETRGPGTISAADLVGRALAPINMDLAAEYTSNSENAEVTTLWRTIWWARIWISVHENPTRSLLGFGYGFPLGDIVPYLQGQFIRTPHNFFFYALGYTGWFGVGLFLFFQAELARLLWRTWKKTGTPFGILFWVTSLVFACFTAFFEAPYGAIPFYLITGCAIPSGRTVRARDGIGIRPAAVQLRRTSACSPHQHELANNSE
jgi:O-Antigen ligase